MMALSKNRISSPLEAGTSILDAHNLPTHLNDAFEYASKRLARKSLHVALVVVRRDYHQSSGTVVPSAVSSPTFPPSAGTPTSPAPSSLSSKLGFAASLKQRLRNGAHPILPGLSSPTSATSAILNDSLRSAAASPAFSISSEASGYSAYSSYSSAPSSKASWPLTPATPATPMSVPPMTPASTASGMTTDSGIMSPTPYGIRLVYGDFLGPKEEKMVREILSKAERKFNIGADWLPSPLHAANCSLTDSIIRRSIVQNETLFASEGITLFSLDRLYTFKSALSSYSRTHASFRLEDAVDELRRLYLANGGRKVSKSDILRSYDWLSVSDSALMDVDQMYRRAYGGQDGIGAIEGMRPAYVEELRIEIDEVIDDMVQIRDDTQDVHTLYTPEIIRPVPIYSDDDGVIAKAMTSFKIGTPPLPKLKLQTNFEKPARLQPGNDGQESEEEEDLTARPGKQPNMTMMWNTASIDGMLNDDGASQVEVDRISKLGPMTPNGYDDISPITRGEWGFLFSEESGFNGTKTVGVTMC